MQCFSFLSPIQLLPLSASANRPAGYTLAMPAMRTQPLQLSRLQSLCAIEEPSDQYRRRARRLRHTLREHPSPLQRALSRLSSEMDEKPVSGQRASILPTSIPARKFETMVREAMQNGPMRYSQRLSMLKTAAAMGLGRFEANLILAIEQNRQFPSMIQTTARNWTVTCALASVVLVQSLIITAAWWIFVR